MCFVALSADHVIANMFFVPLAIFLHHPQISVSYYIWKSMIPAALGNIVGGGLFVGVLYWYLFLLGDDVVIHFDNAPLDVSADRVLPDSGNGAVSGIIKDLHGAQYKREASSNSSSA
jgi:Formate/nitrite transporter